MVKLEIWKKERKKEKKKSKKRISCHFLSLAYFGLKYGTHGAQRKNKLKKKKNLLKREKEYEVTQRSEKNEI